MEPAGARVARWAAMLAAADGRDALVHSGSVGQAAELLGTTTTSGILNNDFLVPLVRLLRDTVPLGAAAVAALLAADVPAAASQLVVRSSASPSHTTAVAALPALSIAAVDDSVAAASVQGGDAGPPPSPPQQVMLLAACAQLLANLATSGAVGADAVWAAAFPLALTHLAAHPAVKVHDPACLAAYACCRASLQRSRQLCSAADASAVFWRQLLGRLAPGGPAGERGTADAQGGGHGWGVLLCGCVALRQGQLAALLQLLQASSAAAGGSAGSSAVASFVVADEGATRQSPGVSYDVRAAAAAGPAAVASARAGEALGVRDATAGGSASGSTGSRGLYDRLVPVLLHVVAQELYDMKGTGGVDVGEADADGAGWEVPPPQPNALTGSAALAGADGHAAASGGGAGAPEARAAAGTGAAAEALPGPELQALPPIARPLACALLHAAKVAGDAARLCARDEAAGWLPPPQGAPAEGAEAQRAEPHGSGGAPASAVLEAALEVLKCMAQREDGGRALAGGLDLLEWLLLQRGLSQQLCGMLAALQPAAEGRREQRQRLLAAKAAAPGAAEAMAAAAAKVAAAFGQQAAHHASGSSSPDKNTSAGTAAAAAAVADAGAGADAPGGAASGSGRIVVELPLRLRELAEGYPRGVVYVGYRGDLASVLANGAFRRRRVAAALLELGALELLLAQSHLDERSPLAREWALWGVRNMCEGNEEVQARIAGLELQTAIETPELQKLGLKIELDKATGKLAVTKTPEAREALSKGAQRP